MSEEIKPLNGERPSPEFEEFVRAILHGAFRWVRDSEGVIETETRASKTVYPEPYSGKFPSERGVCEPGVLTRFLKKIRKPRDAEFIETKRLAHNAGVAVLDNVACKWRVSFYVIREGKRHLDCVEIESGSPIDRKGAEEAVRKSQGRIVRFSEFNPIHSKPTQKTNTQTK